ncbi:hypothetical protein PX699_17610 [Sphingobium sp. H39-3-25]|uniref:hypothetical protein n=1 Tax=Sphingobium arseniciresistens TaxID=3030834 RepID=UPI0023B9147F|nr:hypothetical protein [Sphingobium arseniciresistens]
MRFVSFAAMCVAAFSAPVSAQVAAPVSQPLAVGQHATQTLRMGTEVQLKLQEGLSTEGKKLRVGQHFQLVVVEPVMVGGQVVIPAGAPAIGEITEVRNKGMWGKSGHLTASLLYVSVNGRQIRLNGTFDDKGVTGTGGVVAAVIFVPVVGFFTTGTSARIAAGSQVKGFIGEDVPLTFAEAVAPVPMAVVPTPAAPVLAASSPVSAAVGGSPVATPAGPVKP